MNAAIPPPLFLQCPGVPPILWKQWRPVLQVYIHTAARDATQEHKKALLLNALGVEGLNTYLRTTKDEQQSGADRPTQETTFTNVYDAVLALLNEIFDPQSDVACLHVHFEALRQGPDLTQGFVEFIQEVRRVAKLCELGWAGDIIAIDQIVSGIASPHLQRNIFKMGKDFTLGARRSERGGACRLHSYLERKSMQCCRVRWRLNSPSHSRCQAKWQPSSPSFVARWRWQDFFFVHLLALPCCGHLLSSFPAGSRRCLLSLRLDAASGQLRRLPCQELDVFAMR
ncbi:hypothetical protein HPB51_016212 [Rhipicephalus microplus]|uniref:Uncharacterized protein n=1 Tax=Rhipicephalus microplus TaxID=6941 RepID=A0A9J6EB61_RHIMP|nr:hypothetical protein HPB51_016212 [Rhipicephalus microplus]